MTHVKDLTTYALRSLIISSGHQIHESGGRLTTGSSLDLAQALDNLDAALEEYARRNVVPRHDRHEAPLADLVLRKVDFEQSDDYGSGNPGEPVYRIADANVVSSEIDNGDGAHKLVLDIDHPAKLIPSSTPGHFHLYIDHAMSWERYAAVLLAMSTAGVLEEGFVNCALRRKFTAARLPWVRKESTTTSEKEPF